MTYRAKTSATPDGPEPVGLAACPGPGHSPMSPRAEMISAASAVTYLSED